MLHHVEHGTGVPVIALHGWTPDHRLMLGCMEPVFAGRPGYRRLYPDLPAMGRSPAPPSVASADDLLRAVLDFVDTTTGGEPFLLAGESYGGYLARAVTRERPGQVLGLALVCPVGTAVIREHRRRPPHQVLRRDDALMASLVATDPRTAAEFEENGVVLTERTLHRFRAEVMSGVDLADPVALARIFQRWELTHDPEDGPAYERPTLIVTGRQDASVGYLDQFDLLPHYPRATYAVLDVAGHNLQIEQPVLFEALMGDWLDRVAAERAPGHG